VLYKEHSNPQTVTTKTDNKSMNTQNDKSNDNNPPKVDIRPGQRFGRLTVVGTISAPVKEGAEKTHHYWHVACDCGLDDLVKTLYVNVDFQQCCRECTDKHNRLVAAKAEARKHFNSFRAMLAKWNRQLAYGQTQGPCQQLATILRGD
jgi:hypothetical protein